MNRAKLKQLVDGIESIEKQIKELSKSKRDLLSENASEFDPKAVRKVVARRKMETADRDNEDTLVASYEVALGMAGNLAKEVVSGGKTYDEAAGEAGVSRRTMARHVARERGVPKATADGTPAHDAETGEVIESQGGAPNAACGSAGTAEPSRPAPAPATITDDEAWAAADAAREALEAAKKARAA